MMDLTAEGRIRLREAAATTAGLHSKGCWYHRNQQRCDCGLTATREAVTALLDAMEAAEAERDLLRSGVHELEEMVSHADSKRNEANILRHKVAVDNAALRAALQSAVAACPRRCNEGTFRYPTWQGWEIRKCKTCGPWRELLERQIESC